MTFTPCATGGSIEVVDPRRLRHAAVGVDEAEQRRDREAVHVGVDEPDREPARGERDGEVRGDRRLADAALAARHGDDARERAGAEGHLARGAAAAEALGERPALVGRHDADLERDIRDARRRMPRPRARRARCGRRRGSRRSSGRCRRGRRRPSTEMSRTMSSSPIGPAQLGVDDGARPRAGRRRRCRAVIGVAPSSARSRASRRARGRSAARCAAHPA